jgi:hypothetical protein
MSRFIVVLLFLCSCGGTFTNAGHDAAQGVVQDITSADSEKKLQALVDQLVNSAREDLLGPKTDAEIQALIKSAGVTTRSALEDLISKYLRERLTRLVRTVMDEALGTTTIGEVDTLREHLVGQPLQDDLDKLVAHEVPNIQNAVHTAIQNELGPLKTDVASLKTQADSEAAKWKPVAIGFAVGTLLLLVCVILVIREIRHLAEKHRGQDGVHKETA